MVIGRFCDFAELATSGIEAKDAVGPGYLDTLAKNLRSDKQHLVSRCQEREFAECIRAVLWLA